MGCDSERKLRKQPWRRASSSTGTRGNGGCGWRPSFKSMAGIEEILFFLLFSLQCAGEICCWKWEWRRKSRSLKIVGNLNSHPGKRQRWLSTHSSLLVMMSAWLTLKDAFLVAWIWPTVWMFQRSSTSQVLVSNKYTFAMTKALRFFQAGVEEEQKGKGICRFSSVYFLHTRTFS